MSGYQPKVGDRVRVVLEEIVTQAGDDDEFFIIGDYGVNLTLPEVVSVEKVTPPLPTTPGSLIAETRYKTRPLWVLRNVPRDDGPRWYRIDQTDHSPHVLLARRSGDFDVIFDAGAES